MVLNVDQFRSQLTGGGARANLFEVKLRSPDGIDLDVETTSFLVKTAEIPGSTITPIIIPFRGRQVKISGDRTFDPWTVTVLNDSKFRIRRSMEEWMNYMNNHQDNAGNSDPISYSADLEVRQLRREGEGTGAGGGSGGTAIDENGKPLLYKFRGAWPSDLGPISVSFDNENQIEEYQITFQYQYWTSGTTDGDTD